MAHVNELLSKEVIPMDYRVKIRFKGPLHIGFIDGVGEVSEGMVHADTLFSALVCAYSKLFGSEKTAELIENISDNTEETELLISSAFYYVGDKYFLPRPKGENFNLEKISQPKKLKKIKFVDEEIVTKNIAVEEKDIHGQFLSKSEVQFSNGFEGPVEIFERPRAGINRINSKSNLYYFSEVHFAPNCGLWFYLRVGKELKEEILASLKLLADEGLGGDRTYGFGNFEYKIEEVQLPVVGDKYLLLSPYIPSKNDYTNESKEIAKEISDTYELKYRTGYIFGTDQKAKRVVMFTEGSVFKKPVRGKILDITPDGFEKTYGYRVYRYGKAFLLPFKGGNNV